MKKQPLHILLITFPAQGHINPTLQFAKKLIRMGVDVSFATTTFAHHHMSNATKMLPGLNFHTFSDGFDGGYQLGVNDGKKYMKEFKIRAVKALREIIIKSGDQGKPVTTLVYTLLLPWAAELALEFHIPSALLWIQPASLFDIYYYYFNGYQDEITNNCDNPNWSVQLPGLPLLARRDMPSFLLPPRNPDSILLETYKELVDIVGSETNPILINTFDALEAEALKAIPKHRLIAIGPLIPSAFLDGQDPSDTSFGGDLSETSKDCTEWLNSKPESSVVYVSFGSMLNPERAQMEEIARGLLKTGRPFLWVMRMNKNREDHKDNEVLSCIEELEQNGMIVPCCQLEVLTHPSLGCFVTHCGWNSILESIACGVPMVALPQWLDQPTNAKLLQDVWRTGVGLAAREDGVVDRDEIQRGIDFIMAATPQGLEMRENARKWKYLATEANQETGSSYQNLKSLVEEIGKQIH